ncbi:hypothetical protein C0J52_12362, partial [Blattella germanica]
RTTFWIRKIVIVSFFFAVRIVSFCEKNIDRKARAHLRSCSFLAATQLGFLNSGCIIKNVSELYIFEMVPAIIVALLPFTRQPSIKKKAKEKCAIRTFTYPDCKEKGYNYNLPYPDCCPTKCEK